MQKEENNIAQIDAMFPDETQAFDDPAERNICDSCQ